MMNERDLRQHLSPKCVVSGLLTQCPDANSVTRLHFLPQLKGPSDAEGTHTQGHRDADQCLGV